MSRNTRLLSTALAAVVIAVAPATGLATATPDSGPAADTALPTPDCNPANTNLVWSCVIPAIFAGSSSLSADSGVDATAAGPVADVPPCYDCPTYPGPLGWLLGLLSGSASLSAG
ncbi:hypothetical protein ACIGO9_31030 [Nocardia asteroides]|uniref:hypothetical protein n=1 Tax=Nocardia asteroides TaxID=1824 RepID=UPI0037CBA833